MKIQSLHTEYEGNIQQMSNNYLLMWDFRTL